MIEVVIAGVIKRPGQIITVLLDPAGRRAIPVWIEHANWWPLDEKLHDWAFFMPSSFHLTANMLAVAGADLDSVCLSTIDHDITYTIVRLRVDGTVHEIEARPSDAITLAVIADRPIVVAPEVMARTSVPLPEGAEIGERPGQMLDESVLDDILADFLERNAFHVDEVVEGVYISGMRRRASADALRTQGITRILRLYMSEVAWPEDFVVSDNTLPDSTFVPLAILQRGLAFIREQRAAGYNVLVACFEGVSRSSTFVLAYLVQELGYDLHDAWRLLRARHPQAWPAYQMWESLLAHYETPYTMDDVRRWVFGELDGDGRA